MIKNMNKNMNSKDIKNSNIKSAKKCSSPKAGNNKKTLFEAMPKEFKSIVREYASKDIEPDKFISYVVNNINNLDISIEKFLLMVQSLFLNAVESPKRLYDYSDEEFTIHQKDIEKIILTVEEILEKLKKANKMPLHRDIDCINDDTLASLVQNMFLIQYYYYKKFGNLKKTKEYLEQVVEASKRNIAWALLGDASMVPSEYLEENLHTENDIEFFPGLYPFFEPIIALRFSEPLCKETLYAYEDYYKYIKNLKESAKNQKKVAKIFDYCQKQLCDLYIDQIEDINEEIDVFRCNISVLIREKDRFEKKIRQIQRPGIYPDDYIPTPF